MASTPARLKPRDSQSEATKIRLQAARAALAWLDKRGDTSNTDTARESVRALCQARTLRLQLLHVERSEVRGLRREGRVDATLLRAIERDLDLEEARLSDL